MKNDIPCLLYKEKEEKKWLPVRVLKNQSDDPFVDKKTRV